MAFTNSHFTTAHRIAAGTSASGTPACQSRAYAEGGHQLEKLEFALALAEAKGDQHRCTKLRDRIADLGGNAEEPGT